jgi:hypothetical protein
MEATLKELEQQDLDRRTRAAKYESMKNEIYRHERMITALEGKRAEVAPSMDILAKMLALAESLAPGVLTSRGGLFISAGFELRTLLTDLISKAHADAAAKVKKCDDALVSTKRELAKAQARFKEFQQS